MRFHVDGQEVEVADEPTGVTLLDALRDHLGVRSVKDGCSPQGQCGCCTVLVDGAPRVACVTPASRVAGRRITTVDGLDDDVRTGWAEAFVATGASQCGFCTPGIVLRLEALRAKGTRPDDRAAVDQALLAHLCRCTGWQTIREAFAVMADAVVADVVVAPPSVVGRDLEAAGRRATLEGGAPQHVGTDVVLGRAGFADDTAPLGAEVAVLDPAGAWVVAPSLAEARRAAGKVQGRRTTAPLRWPLEVAPGDWAVSLRTTWVEPAYLEPDASWAAPGGSAHAASPLANGGAFGGKVHSPVASAAAALAAERSAPIRALWAREDVVRLGPKRPPVAIGVRADGTGVARVVRTPGVAQAIRLALPGVDVEEVDVPGPPTSTDLRGAGWFEAAVVRAVLDHAGDGLAEPVEVRAPSGGRATVAVADDGSIAVRVRAGEVLDAVVLRSWCIGAVHHALGLVTSEAIAVDDEGTPQDLTVRSFGVLRAVDVPPIDVVLEPSDGPAVAVADAVLAACATAVWRRRGLAESWPTDRR